MPRWSESLGSTLRSNLDPESKLRLSLAIDFIGFLSNLFPIVGDAADLFWAPVAGTLIFWLYGSVRIAGFGFFEELLPFTDVVPTATLAWLAENNYFNTLSRYRQIFRDILLYGLYSLVTRPFRWRPRQAATRPLPLYRDPFASDALISVVIAAYNEGESIASSIASILQENHVEVIVADGGSTDGTRTAAKAAGARVLDETIRGGRAACLNAGAAKASGEILLFLHADTSLPPGFGAYVRHSLSKPNVALAAFTLSLSPHLPGISLVEWGANRRARRRGLPYGDQALCLSTSVFFDVLGKFPVQPLLEDVDLVCKARELGEVVILKPSVVSSSRRWQKYGVLGNTLHNQLVLLGREVGVPVESMAKWYYGDSGVKEY